MQPSGSALINTHVHMHKLIFSIYAFRASIFIVHLQPIKTLLDLTPLSRKLAAITPGFTGMFGAHIVVDTSTH